MNDQNRNKRLRSCIHFFTKSETIWVLIKIMLHINTAEGLLHFQNPKLCDTACAELSLPGSLPRLTEKPFKWNYSGFTKWGRIDCAAMPCLTCAGLPVFSTISWSATEPLTQQKLHYSRKALPYEHWHQVLQGLQSPRASLISSGV